MPTINWAYCSNVKQLSYRVFICLLLPLLLAGPIEAAASKRLTGDNVLILYKTSDTLSKRIADYYAKKRHVPKSHIVAVNIIGNPNVISQGQFETIQQQIAKHLNKKIKVLLLAWHAPYRVECMSITSAFTLGFDKKYCSPKSSLFTRCHTTAISPYFNAPSSTLWQHKDLRLSMMLSGETFELAKQLIDRGIAADKSHPAGDAYFVRTHDKARSSRWPIFKQLVNFWPQQKEVKLHYIDEQYNSSGTMIKNKKDILFYMTGVVRVPDLNTNTYLPGAIADHLTSFGGAGIEHKGQMSVFRWLEAGVTASYGTVVEPCNFTQKFPNALILVPSYLSGDSVIEAYWKSVQQPGEGLFVGEPLACPWCED